MLLSGAEGEKLGARVRTLDLEAYQVCDGVTHATMSPLTTLRDVNGDFGSLYRLGQNFICLIRPDGHVGLILNPSSAPGLQEYLSRICDPAKVRGAFA
jgi:hypothetical protein